MSRQIFILGVGAHKSGTSFLHRALDAHASVALSNPKEMHVFDAHFLPDLCGQFHRRRRDALVERLQTEPDHPSASWRARMAAMMRHLRMHYDLGEYLSYFRELSGGARITGDITPSYQILQAAHFQAIGDLLKDDFDVKVIFLMRDPVDRVFSAMRMDDRNLNETRNLAHERFGATFKQPKHRLRTEYQSTVSALDAAFPASDVFYEFYENLFCKATFARLEAFLGITGLAPDFDTRVNASPTRGNLAACEIDAARSFYAPTYDFCRDRFGADAVERFWDHA